MVTAKPMLCIRRCAGGPWYTGRRPRWGGKRDARRWPAWTEDFRDTIARLPAGSVVCYWPSGKAMWEKIA